LLGETRGKRRLLAHWVSVQLDRLPLYGGGGASLSPPGNLVATREVFAAPRRFPARRQNLTAEVNFLFPYMDKASRTPTYAIQSFFGKIFGLVRS